MATVGYNGGVQPLPDSLYLPLISDSSGDVFPSNTLTHFRVQLESPLYFGDAEWECGLAEIIWPPFEGPSSKRSRREVDFSRIFAAGSLSGSRPPIGPPSPEYPPPARIESDFRGIFAARPPPPPPPPHAGGALQPTLRPRDGPPTPPDSPSPPAAQDEPPWDPVLTDIPPRAPDAVPSPADVPPRTPSSPVSLAPTADPVATVAPAVEEDASPEADHVPTRAPPTDAAASAREPVRPVPAASEEDKEKILAATGEGLPPPPEAAESSQEANAATDPAPLSPPVPGVVHVTVERPPPPPSDSLMLPVADIILDEVVRNHPSRVRPSIGVPSGSRAFIYCDIVRPSLCSDFRGKCLRIVPIDRGQTHQTLFPVYYFPVEKRVVDTIYVEVKDKFNEYLPFEASDQPLVLVLHFKRVAVAP